MSNAIGKANRGKIMPNIKNIPKETHPKDYLDRKNTSQATSLPNEHDDLIVRELREKLGEAV